MGLGKGGDNGLWEIGTVNFQHGSRMEWGSRLRWNPPPQVRDYLHFKKTPHETTLHLYDCTILYVFFSSGVKNKPHEGVTTPAFIVGPVSMVANYYNYYQDRYYYYVLLAQIPIPIKKKSSTFVTLFTYVRTGRTYKTSPYKTSPRQNVS